MKTLFTLIILTLFALPTIAQQLDKAPAIYKTETLLTDFHYDYKGKVRIVPLKIYFPRTQASRSFPVILMSHGLGGSREVGAFIGNYWAENGFVVVAMQHKGSDAEIIKGKARKAYLRTLKKAMSMENFLNRVHDVPATIDQISKWNAQKTHALYGKMNLSQLGMCGHSFGAVTTQASSGQSFPIIGQKYTDKRIKAAFAMSPSSSRMRLKKAVDAENKAFGKVSIPWLCMTGTKDKVFLSPHVDVENRKKVYKNLPAGDKYQLVLDGATHMAFSDTTLLGKKHRNPHHHKAIKVISTAFFKAYLSRDDKAKQWLQSPQVNQILAPKDSWEKK